MTTKPANEPASAIGTVNGRVITLDSSVPELEGRRVRVLLRQAEDPEVQLDRRQQADLWRAWMDHGEQGPIDDMNSEVP